ncbi:LysR family transcriptional regulator [Ectobacillus sp. JY-23]|uniref:LysR family transcriptional regulator n=1 Tax=Ectobacillus sp. JY-23 TaxID=2933872 RepID=UPI001FF300CC|nr:LysR family transcriptional regulator [Ectobacillus sp. JY-23]UOY93798.1 LysR family transcriptional regulator [Ectobacillus sp. JY-23]
MQLDDFRMMVILAEELNMRKAAERLFVSQPALSQRLQSMEKQWNMKFFIRSQKGLTITPAGEKVATYAKDMLMQEENIKNELSSLQEKTHGTLKIAVASIIGQYWLPRVLKKFVEAYPYVQISLFTGWSSEVQKYFYEGDVHLAILRGSQEFPGRKWHLLTDELYLVDTEIANARMLRETNKPFIQFKSDSTYYSQIQGWWYGLFSHPPKRTIVVDQIETCKQMVLHGIGYAILPSSVLQEMPDHVYKMPLSVDNKRLTRETWLLVNDTALELKQVEAFVELLMQFVSKK